MQGTSISDFEPRKNGDINVVIKRMIIPMGRSSSHIQIRSSEQECLIPLHIGSRHVQKSGGSIHILRKTFLPYHTQQKNKKEARFEHDSADGHVHARQLPRRAEELRRAAERL